MKKTRATPGSRGRADTTYRYAAPGPVPGAVAGELRRVHGLGNQLVEIELAYQDAKDAAWEQDPQVSEAGRAAGEAEAAYEAARETLADARRRAGRARMNGNKAGAAAARRAADAARETARAARADLRAARDRLRAVKAERWPQARRAIAAARESRDTAIRATYPQARAAGMYWASWQDTVSHHKTAVASMNARRTAGRPAQLRYKRWDGTGTVTVQLQRQRGVTAGERAEVARLRAQGLSPSQIAGHTRFSAQTVARMKDTGPEKPGDPPCTPAVLASGTGKWQNMFQLGPELPGDYDRQQRGDRRRIARQGEAVIRVGAGDAQALARLPVTIHRPMPAGAEASMARLTVTRCGPDTEQHLTVTASVSVPPGPAGARLVAAHTGWRVLPDGCLRVAVVAGAGPVPAGAAATGTVRALGSAVTGPAGCHEVVIPAAWRDEQARIDKARARRDAAFHQALEQAAAWLDAHPAAGETLPAGDDVRQWQSPRRLAALAAQAVAGEHGAAARPLGRILGALTEDDRQAWQAGSRPLADAGWVQQDRRAWRNETRARRRLIRRRDDAWAKIAEWMCREASVVLVDGWEIPSLARRPGPGADDPQAAAARANRVLAAPGTLREKISNAARLRGVTVTSREDTGAGKLQQTAQVHWRCGGELALDQRRKGILVPCRRCGRRVDQDLNMLRLMLAR